MKKTFRISALVLVLAMLCTMLCACGDKAEDVNVPVADIAAQVASALGKTDALTTVDDNWIKGWMKADVAAFDGHAVMINAYGANVDEFGIFKAGEDSSAKDVKAIVDAYLQLRMDSWMDEYMPEEKPKLENAEVKVIGNYVMYCILSDADADTAFASFESCLSAK